MKYSRDAAGLLLLILGAVMPVIGFSYGLVALVGEPASGITLTLALTTLGFWTRRGFIYLKRRRKLKQAPPPESPQIAALIAELNGEYTPYIIEAAEQLGKARDKAAVPALLRVLEQSAENQRPGWREVSAALVNALADIGDGRALELLYRLENVRGIGFIPNVRNAIATIEPQAVLLRASSETDSIQSGLLLRPAHGKNETDKALLLRATEADTS